MLVVCLIDVLFVWFVVIVCIFFGDGVMLCVVYETILFND